MRRLDVGADGFEAAFQALVGETRDGGTPVDGPVRDIIAAVRAGGDTAVCGYTDRFDRPGLPALAAGELRVTEAEIDQACSEIPPDLLGALDLAACRIEAFHRAQLPHDLEFKDEAGLTLGLR
ncbi:MAG: histidinol dehydrogenase, partial [Janthinobacterium lividum]